MFSFNQVVYKQNACSQAFLLNVEELGLILFCRKYELINTCFSIIHIEQESCEGSEDQNYPNSKRIKNLPIFQLFTEETKTNCISLLKKSYLYFKKAELLLAPSRTVYVECTLDQLSVWSKASFWKTVNMHTFIFLTGNQAPTPNFLERYWCFLLLLFSYIIFNPCSLVFIFQYKLCVIDTVG